MVDTLFISAGEPSGDQHASRLIKAFRTLLPNTRFRGFGGPAMIAAGAKLEAEITHKAVMGFVEVVPQIAEFWRLAQRARHAFDHGEIDAVILIDYPGFNWHIAKYAKRAGVPVLYYCPPQLWAWAPWRIRKVRRYVDQVLTVLPFEHDWYRRQNVAAEFVGHPFFDAVAEQPLDSNVLASCQAARSRGERLVGILPGSRTKEILANGPLLCEAIRRLATSNPECRFLIGAYRDAHAVWIRDHLKQTGGSELPIDIFVGRTSEVIQASECAMMVSGSVSLELLARETPAAVLYRVGQFTHQIAKRLVHVPSFTLPNLIAGKQIYPEFLSVGDPEPAISGLVSQMRRMLTEPGYGDALRHELAELRSQVGKPGASLSAAKAILPWLPSYRTERRVSA